MNWLDKMLSGMGVPNIAGEQNAALAANPTVQDARGPSGSFDTTRLGNALGPDAQPGLDYLSQIYGMQRGAVTEATKPPTQTGLQFLGRALSAASVPVAYAQGNEGFGRAMTGRTGADQWNQRVSDYEDAARKSQIELAGTEAQGYGSYGLDYLKDKREKTASARKTLAGILAAGRKDDGSLDEASLADAELFANSNGFKDEWEQIKASLPKSMPSPVGQSAPGAAQPGPESVRPLGANLSGMSSMARNLPGSEKPVVPTPYARPPEVDAMYRQAQRVMAVDPERGKAMLESAQIADRAAASVWQKQAESQYDARSGEWSTSNTFNALKDGKPIIIQPGSKGKGKEMELPPGVELLPPDVMAGRKAAQTEVQKARGIAVAGIPQANQVADQLLRDISNLRKDPGLKNVVGMGMGGLVPNSYLMNYSAGARSAGPRLEQIAGKQFLVAFQQLKGAGQITEIEGQKATAAISRLQNTDMDAADYEIALKEAEVAIEEMRQLAIQKARQGLIKEDAKEFMTAPNKKMVFNDETGLWEEITLAPDRTSAGQTSGGRPSVSGRDFKVLR